MIYLSFMLMLQARKLNRSIHVDETSVPPTLGRTQASSSMSTLGGRLKVSIYIHVYFFQCNIILLFYIMCAYK